MKKRGAFYPDEDRARRAERKDWLRRTLAVILSVILIVQGLPTQVIAEETASDTTPAVADTNEPAATPNTAPATEAPAADSGGKATDATTDATKSGGKATDATADATESGGKATDATAAPTSKPDATTDETPKDEESRPVAIDPATDSGGEATDATADTAADSGKATDAAATPTSKPDATTDGTPKDEESKPVAIDFSTVTTNGVVVKIHAPKGAFPAGTTPTVRPADASTLMAAASDLVEGEPVDARAVDICFMKDGAEVEPAPGKSVSVSLRLLAPVDGETFSAVHLADDGSAEVVDEDATKASASFKATEFSVYGIVGGSVVQGPEEEYTRLKVVFRNSKQKGNDGAIVSTQIVHEGDQIHAPDVTSNVATTVRPDNSDEAVPYPTFTSWTANGAAVDAATYFGKDLTEDSIQSFIAAYGATKSSEYDNLYEVTLVASYEEGYRAYFHKYSHRDGSESATYNGVILCSLATTNKQVNLGDFQYVPPTENDKLIGWNAYNMDGEQISIGGKTLFATTDTVTLSDDTDFYPVLAEGISVVLEMNGAASLDNVLAVYDETTGKNVLELDDLPNDIVSPESYYPGYTFDGWYTDSGFTHQITKSNPATFALGTTNAKVYAKWTPKESVSYKVAFLAEDEKGEPGEGNFSVYRTKTYTGRAGDVIPESVYENEDIPYHHLVKQGEIAGDELYKRSVDKTTIKGDGSTIKLVYYTYNRIWLSCKQDGDDNNLNADGSNVFPEKWSKPGESITDWLGDGDYSAYICMADSYKNYVKGDGYTFDGTQLTIPYVSDKSDDETLVNMKAHIHAEVKSTVIGQHYYEYIPGEDDQQSGIVTASVRGEEKLFYHDHDVKWGSSAPYNGRPDEVFGNTVQGGGLVELAYKAKDGENGDVKVLDIPAERVDNPGTITSAWRYVRAGEDHARYYDHYYVRSRGELSFSNYEGVEASAPQNQDAVMFGESIAKYLPKYSNKTTRVYDGNTYYFVGWYTDLVAANNPDDDTSDAFKLAAKATMPASDLALYAGWKLKSCKVTFDAMGGKFASGKTTLTQKVKSGQRVQRPNDPTHTSEAGEQPYEFAGWYKDKEYKESWNFDTDVVRNDTTLYARWYHEKTWTIEYYRPDNTEKPAWKDHFAEGATVNLDAPDEATYNGKPFLGWAIHVGEGESDDDYRIVPNTFSIVNIESDQQIIRLYARYGDAALTGAPTVTFHSNYPDQEGKGETSTVLADPKTPNGQVTLPDYATIGFTRPKGHKLIGWGKSADGSGTVYAVGQPVGVSGEPGENTDLYAIWEYQEYTITFVNDDGTELQSGKVAYGEMPEYAGEEPTKPEDDQYTYAFSGWDPEVVEVTEDATYTATYTATQKPVTPETATLTFDLAGGKLDGKTGKVTMTAKIGETVELLKAPTRDGYTFKYWKGSQYKAGAKYKVEGDHTFTAVWAKNTKPASKPATKTATKTPAKTTQRSQLAKTSDETTFAPIAALAAVGVTAIALGWRKRRQSEM